MGGRSFQGIQRIISMLRFSAGLLKAQKPAMHLTLSPLKNIYSSLKKRILACVIAAKVARRRYFDEKLQDLGLPEPPGFGPP